MKNKKRELDVCPEIQLEKEQNNQHLDMLVCPNEPKGHSEGEPQAHKEL